MTTTSLPIRSIIYGTDDKTLVELPHLQKIIRLHPLAKNPLYQLIRDLESDGLPISVVSHWRSFDHQSTIWNNKWRGARPVMDRQSKCLSIDELTDLEKFEAICYWSAIPGSSRHHWGSDFDIFLQQPILDGYLVNLTPSEFSPSGPCHLLNNWLTKNLHRYDFIRPYQKDCGGVSPEPWHISYAPVANYCLQNFDSNTLAAIIKASDLEGKSVLLDQLPDYLSRCVFRDQS